jgi:polysaccharide biosynthesis transport protein
VLVAICFAITWLGYGKYTARSCLRVAMVEKSILDASLPGTDRDRFDIYKSTQQQLVKNRLVLIAALRKPEVSRLPSVQYEQKNGDAVSWLMSRVRVRFPGDAEIMEVSLSSDDSQEAVTLVRGVVDAYLREVVNAERSRKQERLSELDRAYVEKETEVRARREDLKKLAKQLGASDTDTLSVKQKLALETWASYRQEWAKLEFELRRLHSELAAQQTLLKGIDTLEIKDDVDLLLEDDAIARQLSSALELLKDQPTSTEGVVGGGAKSERAEQSQKEIKRLQDRLDARRTKLGELLRKKKRSAVQTEVRRLQTAIAAMTEQVQGQQKLMDEQHEKADWLGNSNVEIEMMRADIKNLDAALTGIATEREKRRVELRSASRVTLLQRAEVED